MNKTTLFGENNSKWGGFYEIKNKEKLETNYNN
mgnify:CR=1 FL=1